LKLYTGAWFAFALGSISFLVFILNHDMKVQAFSCALIWLCAVRSLPCLTSLLMLILAPLPFLLSPANWIKQGLEIELLYGLAQMSPLYQGFRLFVDPWSGTWAYVDSPFHYAVEGNATVLASLPLFFLLVLMLTSAFRHAES
jgi:hypothetical protein